MGLNSSEGCACNPPIRNQFVLPLTVVPKPGTSGRASRRRPAPMSGQARRSQILTGVSAARTIMTIPAPAKTPCRENTEKDEAPVPSYEVIDVAESTMSRPRPTRHRQDTTSIVVPGSSLDGRVNRPRREPAGDDASADAEPLP